MSRLSGPQSTVKQEHVNPNQVQETGQQPSLDPFYTDLLNQSFESNTSAIEYCRALCAQYGFTVKQEQSTQRNIYVYCSREGLPDSLRFPKSNPKRKRPSKRCDCRWRVVLYENDGRWEFRKSQNPDACKHNHELMRPEEIETPWPKDVNNLIYELARQRLPTQEIRSRVQATYSTLQWNERRFYNRLSEERQKIRYRETAQRAKTFTALWTKICMVTAGSEELTSYAETEAMQLLHTVCEMAQVDPQTLDTPACFITDDAGTGQSPSSDDTSMRSQPHQHPISTSVADIGRSSNTMDEFSETQSIQRQQRRMSQTATNDESYSTAFFSQNAEEGPSTSQPSIKGGKQSEAPKGYMTIVIPQHAYFVKVHNQRTLSEMQHLKNRRRSRSLQVADDGNTIMTEAVASTGQQLKKRKSSSLLSMEAHVGPSSSSMIQSPMPSRPLSTPILSKPSMGPAMNVMSSVPPHLRPVSLPNAPHHDQSNFMCYNTDSMNLDSSLSHYVQHQPQHYHAYRMVAQQHTDLSRGDRGFAGQGMSLRMDTAVTSNMMMRHTTMDDMHCPPSMQPSAVMSMQSSPSIAHHRRASSAVIRQPSITSQMAATTLHSAGTDHFQSSFQQQSPTRPSGHAPPPSGSSSAHSADASLSISTGTPIPNSGPSQPSPSQRHSSQHGFYANTLFGTDPEQQNTGDKMMVVSSPSMYQQKFAMADANANIPPPHMTSTAHHPTAPSFSTNPAMVRQQQYMMESQQQAPPADPFPAFPSNANPLAYSPSPSAQLPTGQSSSNVTMSSDMLQYGMPTAEAVRQQRQQLYRRASEGHHRW
ncbi:uncharacterized protein BYT42DRAFT_612012 [Radiomyces spectabilis]|uniref:uncharacterized protein n=1 Tax=Radiomyces spectabilis TaxID=64574 RepID=UPI002220442A|nr:uncharacterized protein BYT42DRAFT_612012 [Radiomyces spectabilis]KAI8384299.1 hypothetical protein BYT42DRAFT_612012 [Radiomyces spectabilis]